MIAAVKPQTETLAPDELYSWGYRDGRAGKFPNMTMRNNKHYVQGHIAGERDNPKSSFNVKSGPEPHLIRGWADEVLNPL